MGVRGGGGDVKWVDVFIDHRSVSYIFVTFDVDRSWHLWSYQSVVGK